MADEYVDRGESARSADRPGLRAMLDRITEQGDVHAVVVHKLDRLARNMEDHVAIRALLRRKKVALVSVTENLEETPSGKLVEGIHALMAEFYSSNLSAEIRKGMTQKAKTGGWPHQAPLGYRNVRKRVGGRDTATIEPDPDRAALVTAAFDLYATGEWTIEALADEMERRGLRSRGRRDRNPAPLRPSSLARLLANPTYAGLVVWNGVDYDGLHEPLVGPDTFRRVQELLDTRSVRGTRERKHHHYLKGTLYCGHCGRRLSVQEAKRTYLYFYCLGQRGRHRYRTDCREPFAPAGDLEEGVEALYRSVQLPNTWLDPLEDALDAELTDRTKRSASERAALERRLAHAEGERRKLLDAYYSGAIDVALLKHEQERIGADVHAAQDRLAALDASADEWRDVLASALDLAAHCGDTYAQASEAVRKRFNRALIRRVEVKDKRIVKARWEPPFDVLFHAPRFEYDRVVRSSRKGLTRGDGVGCRAHLHLNGRPTTRHPQERARTG